MECLSAIELILVPLVSYHRVLISVIYDEISGAFELRDDQVGYFASFHFFGAAASSAFSFLFATRPRYLLALGVCGLAIAGGSVLLGAATTYPTAVAGRILIGFGCGPVAPLSQTAIFSQTGATKFSLTLLFLISGLGGLIADCFVAPFLLPKHWQLSLFVAAGYSLLAAIIVFIRSFIRQSWHGFLEISVARKQPSSRTLALAVVHFSAVPAVFISIASLWIRPYLRDVFAYGFPSAGLMQSLLVFGAMIGPLVVSLLSRLANKSLLISLDLIGVGLAIGFCFVDVETNQGLLAFLLVLFGFATVGGTPLAAERLARADKTGVIFHHANFLMCFGTAMLQVIASLVMGRDAKGVRELGVETFRKAVWIPAAVVLGIAAIAAVGIDGGSDPEEDVQASLNASLHGDPEM
jgi:MFS family permease